MIGINERYIVDESGNKVQVVLDIEVFQRLMEELEMLEDVRAYDEAKGSPTDAVPFDQAMEEIRKSRS